MLQKEVTVSEVWVARISHNWCACVYAQYGPWSAFPITVWAPFFSPVSFSFFFLPPMNLHLPHPLNAIKNLFFGWEPLHFSSFPLFKQVLASLGMCGRTCVHLSLNLDENSLRRAWALFTLLSLFSLAFLAHLCRPLLSPALFWLLLSAPAQPVAPQTCSWTSWCVYLSWPWAWSFTSIAYWPSATTNSVSCKLMLLFFFCHHCLSKPSMLNE